MNPRVERCHRPKQFPRLVSRNPAQKRGQISRAQTVQTSDFHPEMWRRLERTFTRGCGLRSLSGCHVQERAMGAKNNRALARRSSGRVQLGTGGTTGPIARNGIEAGAIDQSWSNVRRSFPINSILVAAQKQGGNSRPWYPLAPGTCRPSAWAVQTLLENPEIRGSISGSYPFAHFHGKQECRTKKGVRFASSGLQVADACDDGRYGG